MGLAGAIAGKGARKGILGTIAGGFGHGCKLIGGNVVKVADGGLEKLSNKLLDSAIKDGAEEGSIKYALANGISTTRQGARKVFTRTAEDAEGKVVKDAAGKEAKDAASKEAKDAASKDGKELTTAGKFAVGAVGAGTLYTGAAVVSGGKSVEAIGNVVDAGQKFVSGAGTMAMTATEGISNAAGGFEHISTAISKLMSGDIAGALSEFSKMPGAGIALAGLAGTLVGSFTGSGLLSTVGKVMAGAGVLDMVTGGKITGGLGDMFGGLFGGGTSDAEKASEGVSGYEGETAQQQAEGTAIVEQTGSDSAEHEKDGGAQASGPEAGA